MHARSIANDFSKIRRSERLTRRLRPPLRGWCRQRGLNSRPSVYKTAALPLSYAGPREQLSAPPLWDKTGKTPGVPLFQPQPARSSPRRTRRGRSARCVRVCLRRGAADGHAAFGNREPDLLGYANLFGKSGGQTETREHSICVTAHSAAPMDCISVREISHERTRRISRPPQIHDRGDRSDRRACLPLQPRNFRRLVGGTSREITPRRSKHSRENSLKHAKIPVNCVDKSACLGTVTVRSSLPTQVNSESGKTDRG